jgi:hypothetical protein
VVLLFISSISVMRPRPASPGSMTMRAARGWIKKQVDVNAVTGGLPSPPSGAHPNSILGAA